MGVPRGATTAPTGARYQPLTRALVVAPCTGGELRLPAAAGATVHAVADGVIGSRSPFRLDADDGCRFRYEGMRCLSGGGVRVAAGDVVGVVVPHSHTETWASGGAERTSSRRLQPGHEGDPEATCLHLAVTGPDGEVLDPYELLAGLPDPAEPGWWVTGNGVDPELAPWARMRTHGPTVPSDRSLRSRSDGTPGDPAS